MQGATVNLAIQYSLDHLYKVVAYRVNPDIGKVPSKTNVYPISDLN